MAPINVVKADIPGTDAPEKQLDGVINVSQKVTCPKEVEKNYDTWAESYETDSEDLLGFSSPLECARAAAKFCKNGDSFLDVGCGTGLVAKHLATTHAICFSHSMGCDLSMNMLTAAKTKGLYHEVSKLDMSMIPWSGVPSERFDIVTCNGVLIYVEEVNCLDEFLRVTKCGGHICLMFRHDGYSAYEAKVEALIQSGKWELVHKSETRRNFETTRSEAASNVLYNIW
eukprot:CAMPEP_0117662720 /NCGR_PEP_ID=MMETSP0804-20121206/8201_1 /TAXON_ID=1074897 /ORGANISM="Tetraselmis astigmatica, Strain CCMP880" /LENGTH=227 /DNA_ID=CAMNT_0005469633 /DNA_START=222 /DNA_END=902 /DNA_ORIENTATION=-